MRVCRSYKNYYREKLLQIIDAQLNNVQIIDTQLNNYNSNDIEFRTK